MKKKFYYTARNKDGRIYESSVYAESKAEVYSHIREENAVPIKVYTQKEIKWSLQYWNQRLSTVKPKDKIVFASNLAAMLAAGLSSTHALTIAEKQAQNPRLKYAILKMRSMVESGFSLNVAFAKFPDIFPPIFVAMVKAGERSGNLPQALETIAKQLKNSYELKGKIKGAMIYPAIVLLAIIGIGIFMTIKVVPVLAETFQSMNMELPLSTRIIISASAFMQKYYLLVLALLFGIVFGIVKISRNPKTRFIIDSVLLRLPLINVLYNESNAAYFARTLSSLLKSGVHITEALDITTEVVPGYYHKRAIQAARETVTHGGMISTVLAKYPKLFPTMLYEMLAVGEETGKTTDMLESIAEFYEKEVDQKTKTFSTIIEPFLMLFVGIVVGFFAVAMIKPIYSISDAF